MLKLFSLLILMILLSGLISAQDSVSVQPQVSKKYLDAVSAQAGSLEEKLDKKSQKVLARLQKQEAKMRNKLMKIDSVAANNVFANAGDKYKELQQRLKGNSARQYIPKLDTLVTSLKFLQSNPELLAKGKEAAAKLKEAMGKVDGMKDKFQQAEAIKQFIKERKQFLKDQLSKFGFAKELKKLNKEVYYYAQQVNEYKEILKDSKKAEKKAIELLSKTKMFKDFMRKNSALASIFRVPGDPNDPAAQANLSGLQTRAQVNTFIQQQIAAGGPGARDQFRQNLQQAQSQINQLKSRIGSGGSSDDIMPEGFKPNNQKGKSFLKRLELGTNLQTTKSNSWWPVTSDLGLSVGYKLNDKSIVGIGASYKLGLGNSFRNIRFSQQGAAMRSFLDWKLKGSLWISGGYEMNYRTAFSRVSQLNNLNAWQQSGLVGLSKTVSVKSKFFKKTKLQLLWDFLSYQQIPQTQPVLFRVGYNF